MAETSALDDGLPLDVVREIVDYFVTPHFDRMQLCTLRLVCATMDTMLKPLLFPTFHVAPKNPTTLNLLQCREILADLATDSTTAYNTTTRIKFDIGKLIFLSNQGLWFTENCENLHKTAVETMKTLDNHLVTALSKLTQVETVVWVVDPRYESAFGLYKTFMTWMSTLPCLRNLDLDFNFRAASKFASSFFDYFPLHLISNLESLRLKCAHNWDASDFQKLGVADLISRSPNLERLAILKPPHSKRSINLDDIFQKTMSLEQPLPLTEVTLLGVSVFPHQNLNPFIRHLGNLQTLDIDTTLLTRQLRFMTHGGYLALQNAGIKVSNLIVDSISNNTLFYWLSTFSGLKELSLGIKHPKDDKPVRKNTLFCSILPRNAWSLKKLNFFSLNSVSTIWSNGLSMKEKEGILSCRQLQSLNIIISITKENIVNERCSLFTNWLELLFNLPELRTLSVDVTSPNWEYWHKDYSDPAKKVTELFRLVFTQFESTRYVHFKLINIRVKLPSSDGCR